MRKRKDEPFKLDNTITWYLKDHEGDVKKQRKIIEKNNGELFYIFKPIKEEVNEWIVGEG